MSDQVIVNTMADCKVSKLSMLNTYIHTLLQVKIIKIQVEYSFNSKNKDGYHLCLLGKDTKPFLYRSKEGQNYTSDMFLWLLLR